MRTLITIVLFSLSFLKSSAQENDGKNYIAPTDPLVKQNLQHWQDLKFGLLMHWGTYSQWGIVESWSLCPEDEGWCQRKGEFSNDWFSYQKAYENLQTTFNPVKFNPKRWAQAAFEAGMKYVVFTTKHHDGFCMFDTKTTDYSVANPKCPFSSDPRSNIAKEIFGAFRAQNMLIGAYFSKPDWHAPDYWWSYFPPKDRNVNYDPKKYPERWEKFKQFTYEQISELMQNYGKIDILWLDGGWVRAQKTIDQTAEGQKELKYDQDINMPNLVKIARKYQPGLIVVDRSVGGEYENYITPEQKVPEKPLDIPWESCITMGDSWSYIFVEHYKSAQKIIHTLCDIVSKGGNLLLNIGPGPDGEWHEEAYLRLKEVGNWMKINGEAIYETRPVAPYRIDQLAFTKRGKFEYVIFLPNESSSIFPTQLAITSVKPKENSKIHLLGFKEPLKWVFAKKELRVFLPKGLNKNTLNLCGVVLKIEKD